MDGDLVETFETFGLGQALGDEEGVEVFQMREAHELGTGGVVADVAFVAGVLAAPLRGGLAEEGRVEYVGFTGIDEAGLGVGQLGRDEVSLDGVGVDAVVNLGEVPPDVPAEGLALGFLQALEFLDEVELELDGDPRGELQRKVQMRIGAAVASGFGLNTDGRGALDPLLRGEGEAVEAGLLFKPVEFDGIKTGVVDLLPDAGELDGVAVAEPNADEVVAGVRVFVAGDVGQADVILVVDAGEANFAGEDFDFLLIRGVLTSAVF